MVRFEEYLVNLLRPLGVYDLRTGTINRGELAAYGAELDSGLVELEDTAREMNLTTAKGFGLERIEALLPYRPVCTTVDSGGRRWPRCCASAATASPRRPSTTP